MHRWDGHGAVVELRADDALRGPAQAIALETYGAFEVLDAEGDEGDASFHCWAASQIKAATSRT